MADSGQAHAPPGPSEADRDAAIPSRGGAASDAATSGETAADTIRRPSSLALLADLERRVRRLEARVEGLEGSGGAPRRLVRASDVVRWGLWLVVIAFLAFYWVRLGAPR